MKVGGGDGVPVDGFACLFTVVIEHSVTLEAFPDVIREKTNAGGDAGREGGRAWWKGEGGALRAVKRERGREGGRGGAGGGRGES